VRAADSPSGTANGRKPALRRQARDPFQVLGELLLFERKLRSRIEMLQRAAATNLKVRAARLHAIGGGRQHSLEPRLIVLTMATPPSKADGLPGQRTCHERSLTLANDAGTFVAQATTTPVSWTSAANAARRLTSEDSRLRELGVMRLIRVAQQRAHAFEFRLEPRPVQSRPQELESQVIR